jgi:hypothetical protein
MRYVVAALALSTALLKVSFDWLAFPEDDAVAAAVGDGIAGTGVSVGGIGVTVGIS